MNRNYSTTCSLAAIILGLLLFSQSQAAPVTLAFEAEIVRVTNRDEIDIGISPALGQTIVGALTFEQNPTQVVTVPVIGPGGTRLTSEQPYSIDLRIGSATLKSQSPYSLTVVDNSIVVDGDPLVQDSIRLEFPGLASVNSQISDVDLLGSSITVSLLGAQVALGSSDIPPTAEQWNTTNLSRLINISLLHEGAGASSITMQATVGEFTLVPEPAGHTLAFLTIQFFLNARFKNQVLPVA